MSTMGEEKLAYVANQIRELQQLAGTITTSVANLEPTEIIQNYIETEARANLVALNTVKVNRDLIGSPARSLIVGTRGTVTASSVTEGSAITKINPSYTPATITPTKIGLGVEITHEAIEGFHFDLINGWLEEAGYAMAKNIDSAILGTIRTSSGIGSVDASSSNTLAYDDVISAVSTIRGQNYTPDTLIIHPNQQSDLLKDTKFVNASAYGDSSAIKNGEIGKFAGLTVYVTNQAADGTALVYDSNKACIAAFKRGLTVRRDDTPEYDSITLWVTEMFAPLVIHSGAVCAIHGC
jgi:HK97 family phage major capsid protein